jgi:hypothetical protein
MSTHLADDDITGGVRTKWNGNMAVAFAMGHSDIRIREQESSGYHQEREREKSREGCEAASALGHGKGCRGRAH